MPLSLSKEELDSFLEDDAGFRSLLASMPVADQQRIAQILADPSLLSQLLGFLPTTERQQIEQTLTTGMEEAQAALRLFEQCRFFEARDLLRNTLKNYTMPEGLPDDGVVRAASFVVVRVQALFHGLLGSIEQALGNVHISGDHHHTALLLARECGDADAEAKALYGLGVYFYELGDFEQALEYSRTALETLENGADRWATRGKVYNTLSLINGELSQWDDAMHYGDLAIAELELRQDMKILPVALSNRAAQLTDLRAFEQIPTLLERALDIAIENGALQQEGLVRHNIGMHLLNSSSDSSSIEQAIEQFRLACTISETVHDCGLEGLARSGLAHALIMVDDYRGAEREFRRTVGLFKGIDATADSAHALVSLGNTLRYCHADFSGALQCYRDAVELTEKVRSRLKRESHRIGLTEARTEPYQQIITLLLEMWRVDEAFHYLERARSKSLLELLAGQFEVNDDSLFGEAAEMARRIAELRCALEELQSADETADTHLGEDKIRRASMRGELQQGLENEELQFSRLCEELQRISPERHGLVAVQAAGSAEVQAVLPADTALVELYQTDEQLLLFVIHPDQSVKVITVELTADDAAEMVFALIVALRDPTTFDTRSHDYLRTVRQPSSQLHEAIFGPIEEILEGVKRLVIVPHHFWHYLPFHALYDGRSKQFLLDSFEISYAPSASALVICRGKKQYLRDNALILCRNDGDLPHVEAEGTAIGKVFDRAEIFCGSEAALNNISHQTTWPDVIHCACHGYFDPEQPFLSGIAIPLDKTEDRPALLIDLLRLRLESSLVTLSACDTGLSRISKADELVGLSRGIFGAGAASILLSLWKVADSSTAYLMENFYWHYVANRQTKGRALHLAMQAVRAKPEYSHPYYWAPFVVMGEWE